MGALIRQNLFNYKEQGDPTLRINDDRLNSRQSERESSKIKEGALDYIAIKEEVVRRQDKDR